MNPDPEMSAEIILAVLDAAFAAGMSPDIKSFSVEFSDKGDAAVKATDSAGNAFDAAVSADDLAAAMDLEPADGEPDAAADEAVQA